jgi:excisionase family DNA binding protein
LYINGVTKLTSQLSAYHGALVATKTWLTRQEAADYLGVSVSMIDRQLRHTIPTYQVVKGGKAYLFKRDDLDSLVEGNRVGPDEEFFI